MCIESQALLKALARTESTRLELGQEEKGVVRGEMDDRPGFYQDPPALLDV